MIKLSFVQLANPSHTQPPSRSSQTLTASCALVPADSPSRGGDGAVQVLDINQPSLITPFFLSALVSIYLFMTLLTVFRSINETDNSPLSHSVLPVLFLSC